MAFTKDIRAAKASGQMVRIKREAFDEGWLTGYVVETGPKFFALELITGGVRLDGMACMRFADVTACAPEPHAAFLERALKARGAVRAKTAPVDLSTPGALIGSAGKAFPIVTLHVPSEENRYDCYIGQVVAVNRASVDLRHITPDAEWEDGLREIPFSEIVRVDFGGDYEDALFLAAV